MNTESQIGNTLESRLARLARRQRTERAGTDHQSSDETSFGESAVLAGRAAELEQCELCAAEIPDDHQHLIDVESQRLLCVCRACVVLFDNSTAGPRRYTRVPDRVREIEDFRLDDDLWDRLGIPVDIAFCFRSTLAQRIVAFYPSPAGATESMLQLAAWSEIETLNPVLSAMQADVEALLIDRARGSRRYFLLPVDTCYRLVGIMRTRWRGLSGGDEVWSAIATFFEELQRRADRIDTHGNRADRASYSLPSADRSGSVGNSSYEAETHG